MENVVKCWHCKYYKWFSDDKRNQTAICDIKNSRVSANDKVCEEFVLHQGIHTARDIPKYCRHYNNK
ncbi:MAG: hypothetical protein E7539_04010 [Ruminococcaceae bacterium]|nr:hypothetical protein [Oscillospiraceae bacterium]